MTKVVFIGADGVETSADGKNGYSLMEVAVANGVAGINGDCGGAAACGTCHIYVDPRWIDLVGRSDTMEETMLGLADRREPNSRLACQVKISEALDGIIVQVPEE